MTKSIQCEYTLTADEVREAFAAAGKLKFSVRKAAIQSGLLLLCAGLFAYYLWHAPDRLVNYLVIAVALGTIAIIWIMPRRAERRMVEGAVTGQMTRLTLSRETAHVYIPETNFNWSISLAETLSVLNTPNLFILRLADKRLFVVPKRAIQHESMDQAAELLLHAGIDPSAQTDAEPGKDPAYEHEQEFAKEPANESNDNI